MVTQIEVREMAAELLLTLGVAWETERLLWLGGKQLCCSKEQGAQGARALTPMAMLTPSMIRRVMKFFIMSGGLPASRAAFERGSDQFAQVRDVLPERQQLAQGEEEEEEEQVTGQAAVAAIVVGEEARDDDGALVYDTALVDDTSSDPEGWNLGAEGGGGEEDLELEDVVAT